MVIVHRTNILAQVGQSSGEAYNIFMSKDEFPTQPKDNLDCAHARPGTVFHLRDFVNFFNFFSFSNL